MSNSPELAFDISSNIPEVVAGAVQALGLLGKAATDAGAAVGSAGKKTAGSTKSMRDSVEALKMMAYELSEESKRLGDTQAGSAAKLRAMAGAIQASSDRMSDAISTMSKAAGILNRQEVSASSITKWAGLAKIAAADFSEALKSAGAEVAKFKAMTSFDPASHSKVFGMGRDTIRQATADTKRELAGHYNALGVFISNGQAKLAADLAKSANAHTAATAEMRARAVAEWSAANKALKSSAFGLGRDTIRQATADTKRELAGHYNALGVFISNAQAELAAKASAGTAANAAVQAKALGLGRDTIRQATADTKRELAGHYNALGMFISNAATPAAAAAPSASEIAASAKRSKVEVEALSKSLRHLTIDGNEAHSMARGLASGFNLLWLTWGNLAPLFAGSAISFGVSRTFSIGMEVEQNIKFLEVLGDKTKEQGSAIREELRKIDQSTLFSLTELSKAMVELEQGGVSGARGLEVVKVAADLAAVGNTNLDVTSRLLMQTMNLFPQTTADVTKSAAQMFQVTKDGALNIEDIGDAMKYASTSGVVYGQTFEDVLVTLKALAAGGIKGTSAGTSWINFLQDIAGRSKPAKAALEELEVALGRTISTFDSKGQARAALDVLSDINEGLSKFKPQAAKELMDRIFNERGIRTAAAAIRDGTVDLGKYKEMLGEVKGEFLTTNAAQLMDTTKGALDILKGTMVGVLDKTFESMGTGFRDTIKNLTSTINSDEFANLMRGMVGSFAALADVAVRVLPELSKIAAVFITFKAVSFAQTAVSGLAASMVPLIGYLNLSAGGMVATARSAAVAATNVTGLGTSMLVSAAAAKASAAGLEGTAAAAAVATMRLQATTGVTRILAVTLGFLANPIVGLVTTLGTLGATWWATSQSGQTASEELSANVWKDGKLNIKVLDEEIAKIKERDAVRAAGMEAPTTELDSLLAEAKAKWDKSRELRRKLEGPGLTEQQKSSRAPFMPKALADETQAHEAWFTLYTRRQEVLDNKAKLQAETEKKRNAGVKAATEKAEADAKRQLSGLDRLGKEGTAQQAAQNALDNDLRYNRLDEIAKANKTELDGLRSHLNSQTEALKDFRDANMVQEGEYQSRITSITLEGEKAQKAAAISGWLSYAAEIDRLLTGLSAMPKSQISDNDKANRVQELHAKLLAKAEEFQSDMAKIDEEANKRERRLATDQYKELDKLRKANETAIANSKDRVQAIRDEQEMADKTLGLGGADLEATQARLKIELEAKKELRKFDLESLDKIQARDRLRADAELATDDETWEAKHRRADDFDAQLRILAKGRADFEAQTQTEAAVTVAAVYRKEFRRRTDEIGDELAGGLTDAVLLGGKEGGQRLRKLLEKELISEPFTIAVRAMVQPFAQAMAGFTAPGANGAPSALNSWLWSGQTSGTSILQAGDWLATSSNDTLAGLGTYLQDRSAQISSLATSATEFLGYANALNTAFSKDAQGGRDYGKAAGQALGTTFGPLGSMIGGEIGSALGLVDYSGTMHTGGLGSYSRAGGAAYGDTVKSQGLKFGVDSKDYSAATAQASVAVATSVANMLDSTATTFGSKAGYYVATAFADDISPDGAWGTLMVKLGDTLVTDWETGRNIGREFSDGEAGAKEYAAAVAKDVRDYLITQTPAWADTMLTALGDAPSLDQLAATVGQINATATALEGMGRASAAFAGMAEGTASALIASMGGAESAVASLSGYYTNFYTESERAASATTALTGQLAELGKEMPASREAFRGLVDAAIAAGDTTLAAGLINLQDEFAALVPAANDAATAVSGVLSSLEEEGKRLKRQLIEAQGGDLVAFDTEGMTLAERAAYAYNQSVRAQIDATNAAKTATDTLADTQQQAADTAQRAAADTLSAWKDTQQSMAQSWLDGAQALQTMRYETAQRELDAARQAASAIASARTSAAQASIDAISGIAGALTSAREALTGAANQPLTTTSYGAARGLIDQAAATGSLNQAGLEDALKVVSGNTQSLFGRFEDWAMAQASAAVPVSKLDAQAQGQMAAAQAIIDAMKAQEDEAALRHDENKRSLGDQHSAMMDSLQMQYDAQIAQIDATQSVAAAMGPFLSAITSSASGGAGGGGQTASQQAAGSAQMTSAISGLANQLGITYGQAEVMMQTGQSPSGVGNSSYDVGGRFLTAPIGSAKDIANKAQYDTWSKFLAVNREQGVQKAPEYLATMIEQLKSSGGATYTLGTMYQTPEQAMRESLESLGWKGLDLLQKLPGYAVGTPYVPQDGPAFLHKGEMVVPAAYNPNATGYSAASGSNAEIVAELRAVRAELQAIRAATTATAGFTAGTDRQLRRAIKSDAITTETV